MATITGNTGDNDLYDELGAQSDQIAGFEGNDTIFMADDEGNNFVDGGDDYDLISYELFSYGAKGVTIEIFLGRAEDGFGYVDSFVNIEDARGTNYDDDIWGDEGGNILEGLEGDDLIGAFEGDDWLYGDGGDDFLSGGEGADDIYGGSGVDAAMYGTSTAGGRRHPTDRYISNF